MPTGPYSNCSCGSCNCQRGFYSYTLTPAWTTGGSPPDVKKILLDQVLREMLDPDKLRDEAARLRVRVDQMLLTSGKWKKSDEEREFYQLVDDHSEFPMWYTWEEALEEHRNL